MIAPHDGYASPSVASLSGVMSNSAADARASRSTIDVRHPQRWRRWRMALGSPGQGGSGSGCRRTVIDVTCGSVCTFGRRRGTPLRRRRIKRPPDTRHLLRRAVAPTGIYPRKLRADLLFASFVRRRNYSAEVDKAYLQSISPKGPVAVILIQHWKAR